MQERINSQASVDAISKGLAASTSRRDVLRLLGSVAVGGLMGLFGTRKAEASVVENCPACGTCKSCNFDAEGCTDTCSQACVTASLCNEAHSNQQYLQLKQYLLDQGFRQRFEPTSIETSGQAFVSSKTLTTQFVRSRVLTYRKPHYLDQVAYLRFVKTSEGNIFSHVEIGHFKTLLAVLTVSDANVIQHSPNPNEAQPQVHTQAGNKALLVSDCEAVVGFACGTVFDEVFDIENLVIAAVCVPGTVAPPVLAACIVSLKYAFYRANQLPNPVNGVCSDLAQRVCQCSATGIQIRPKCGDTCCGAYQTCCDGNVCPQAPLFVCCPDGTISCGNVCCPRSPYVVCDRNSTSIFDRCKSVCPPGTATCGRNCCGSGQICTNAATGTCGCALNQETCGSFCCPPGKICTNPTLGTCGCPATQVSCGNTCCPSGQLCNGTTCVTNCPNGTIACQGRCVPSCANTGLYVDPNTCECRCVNGGRFCPGGQPNLCCAMSSVCTSIGTCCPPNYFDCNGGCCPNNSVCSNGICCPAGNYNCNGACCPTATSKCCPGGPAGTCYSPTAVCCPPVGNTVPGSACGAGTKCCVNGSNSAYYCCGSNQTCCPGIQNNTCASPGSRCCISSNGFAWVCPDNYTCGAFNSCG